MIYFMQPPGGGPVKIGFSNDVDARVRQLESHYGRALAVLATMDGGRAEEAEIHSRFAHLRLGRTEQFQPGPDLMAFIDRPLFVNQGDVELMPPARPEVKTKPVRLDLAPELHKRLRVVSAEQGKPMAVFARELVEKAVNELYSKRG